MKIRAFRGLRPLQNKAARVASRPYDVLSSDEAREEVRDNPLSFLNVVKPEITLPVEIDQYDKQVYEAGKGNFRKLVDDGVFFQDDKPCLYLYELTMDGRSQTGIVACAAVEDYMNNRIKKHELTRPDKENDRKNHVRVSMMNAEPVFFAYKSMTVLDELSDSIKSAEAEYSFTADDNVEHKLWLVAENEKINQIIECFAKMPATYVADGHHRTAAAALVGDELKKENPQHNGEEEYNYFLAVHFPDNQLEIIDYNRLVKDLNGLDSESFIVAVSSSFKVEKLGQNLKKPERLHDITMYLDGEWYSLSANSDTYDDSDPIDVLDVTILSRQIFEPVLGIHDLRTDKRVEFVGGIRGLDELKNRVDSGEMTVAFAMYPVSMKQLMDIADNDLIMPPKVTWFEPKLRSGLVVHSLEN
ncbi:MAG: DUF1015 family protein [Gammaproteobacteria bacterium]|nr:DUF1015 family protein [Gammaproteobacteria bacterium]